MSLTLLEGLSNLRERLVWWIPPNEWRSEMNVELAGLLPGSFNPLHRGHLRLREAAAKQLGGTVACELSMANAEKRPLTVREVERRCKQFAGQVVAVTAAATFVEKSRLFPGTTFVVGADTAARIVAPRFYGGDAERMDAALSHIREQACSFLVAARRSRRELVSLDKLPIPPRHTGLFQEIPSADFLMDLSSTRIRERT